MRSSLMIEPCSANDVDQISEVAIRAYRDVYLYLWDDDGSWYINRCFLPEKIHEEIRDTNAAFFFLKSNAEVVGFLKMNVDQPLKDFEEMNALELERIYMVKSASGKGFGRQALEFCFDFARQRNKQVMWLKCMSGSPAHHFYERLGFVQCGGFDLDFTLMKAAYRRINVLMKPLT